jgi:hypothetical protein
MLLQSILYPSLLAIALLFNVISSIQSAGHHQVNNGVSFSPAGLLTPFHLGVANELKSLKLIDEFTHLAGSSGGALAASLTALNVNLESTAVRSCTKIASSCLKYGTRGNLRVALDAEMKAILPENSAELLQRRPGTCAIAYTEIYPNLSSRIVTEYSSRNDIEDVLRASCNIPFYFNGNSPFVQVRGSAAVDGFFAVKRSRFGCPPPQPLQTSVPHSPLSTEILVCPFPASAVGLHIPAPVEKMTTTHVISPEILPSSSSAVAADCQWPFTLADLLQLALTPPSYGIYEKIKAFRASVPADVADESSPIYSGLDESERYIEFVYRYLFAKGSQAARCWHSNAFSISNEV